VATVLKEIIIVSQREEALIHLTLAVQPLTGEIMSKLSLQETAINLAKFTVH